MPALHDEGRQAAQPSVWCVVRAGLVVALLATALPWVRAQSARPSTAPSRDEGRAAVIEVRPAAAPGADMLDIEPGSTGASAASASDGLLTSNSLLDLGNKDYVAGHFELALQSYRTAEEKLPPAAPPALRAYARYSQGRALHQLTRYAEAVALYEAALRDQRTAGDARAIGATLHALGDSQAAAGDAATARTSHLEALQFRRQAGDADGEARTLINLAQNASAAGSYVEALGRLDAATAAMARSAQASVLDRAKLASSIGVTRLYLGQYDAALLAFADAARRYASLPGEAAGVAESLRNQAVVHIERGEFARAATLFAQAVDALPADRAAERAVGQNGLGYALVRQGRAAEALPPLAAAMAAQRRGAPTIELARTLESLGSAHLLLGDEAAALAEYLESLQLARHWKSPDDERELLFSLGKFYVAKGEVAAAIVQLKLAVNLSQQLRRNAAALGVGGRTAYASRLSEPYKVLARLLLDQGRVAEGERVLLALKEVEFFDYVRGEGVASASAEVALTADEARVLHEVNGLVEPLTRLFAQMQEHLQGVKPLPDDELATLQDKQNQLNLRLQAALARIDARLKKPEGGIVTPLVQDSMLADLVEKLAAPPLGEDAVALAYVPEERVTTVVITTRGQPIVLQLDVGLAVLDPLVRELRAAIRDKRDHLPSARALHRYLVAPVEQELARQQLAPKTWMLFLTDKLRYMPFAALVGADGRHVIESHQLAVLTAPAIAQMTVAPTSHWSVRAFGSTAAVPSQQLSALPGAREEVRGIVRSTQNPDGILPGQALLDDDFTRPAWLAIFRQGAAPAPAYSIVHVASHFNALAGDWANSFLVLGGGDLYRMSELSAASQLKLSHLDLITLAACATEVNDQGNGKELEGMGVMLQKRGARAVIGTLWTVQDEGSAALMQAFYRAHGEQRRMSKAAALQAAQLDLLQGRVVSSNQAVSLKHPYYWAPFLLMGNWL